jgi:hypothetical protein
MSRNYFQIKKSLEEAINKNKDLDDKNFSLFRENKDLEIKNEQNLIQIKELTERNQKLEKITKKFNHATNNFASSIDNGIVLDGIVMTEANFDPKPKIEEKPSECTVEMKVKYNGLGRNPSLSHLGINSKPLVVSMKEDIIKKNTIISPTQVNKIPSVIQPTSSNLVRDPNQISNLIDDSVYDCNSYLESEINENNENNENNEVKETEGNYVSQYQLQSDPNLTNSSNVLMTEMGSNMGSNMNSNYGTAYEGLKLAQKKVSYEEDFYESSNIKY